MPVGLFWQLTLLTSLGLALGVTATAADEPVLIRKVVRDKAILVRGRQEFYLIQTSAPCRSLVGHEGDMVLVRSPWGFLGPHSQVLLAGGRQQCKITLAAALSANADSNDTYTLEQGCGDQSQAVMAVQEGLMLLGRDPGAVGSKSGTMKALNEIRERYGNDASLGGLKKTVLVVALQVVSHNPSDARAKEVSRKLLKVALGPESKIIQP